MLSFFFSILFLTSASVWPHATLWVNQALVHYRVKTALFLTLIQCANQRYPENYLKADSAYAEILENFLRVCPGPARLSHRAHHWVLPSIIHTYIDNEKIIPMEMDILCSAIGGRNQMRRRFPNSAHVPIHSRQIYCFGYLHTSRGRVLFWGFGGPPMKSILTQISNSESLISIDTFFFSRMVRYP